MEGSHQNSIEQVHTVQISTWRQEGGCLWRPDTALDCLQRWLRQTVDCIKGVWVWICCHPLPQGIQWCWTHQTTPLIPVKANAPVERLQIVDSAKNPSEVGQATFPYALSILHVFTKYLWLYPVENKWCATVTTHLKAHFFDWGGILYLSQYVLYSLTQITSHNI